MFFILVKFLYFQIIFVSENFIQIHSQYITLFFKKVAYYKNF